jgi:propionyl-CoA carboxylase beta chain
MEKLTARQRIELLLDKNSFQEIDALVVSRNEISNKQKIYGDGIHIGTGTVIGRKVCVFAEDITYMGGTSGEEHSKKLSKIIALARNAKVPLIGFLSSGGGRIQEGILAMEVTSKALREFVLLSGYIPTITVVCGVCAGGAAYLAAASDFTYMIENESVMLLTGPKVIEKVLLERCTKEELGGTLVHGTRTGNASFVVESEWHVFEGIKRLLSYLPDNFKQRFVNKYSANIHDKRVLLNDIIPENTNHAYDIFDVISHTVDEGSFYEVNASFAPNIVVGFAKLGSRNIGIIGNQPLHLGGSIDNDALKKSARFQQICDAYNIPLLFLVDSPGILPGKEQERNGLITNGAKLFHVLASLTIPRITLILRRAIGGAFGVMNPKGMGADLNFAWHTAEIAVVGSDASLDIIFAKEALKHSHPESYLAEKKETFKQQFLHPYEAAKYGYIDEVIFPEDTRIKLLRAFAMLENKVESLPEKKRNIMPM